MQASSIFSIGVIIIILLVALLVWRIASRGVGGGGRATAPTGLIARGQRGDIRAQKELGYIYATGSNKVRLNLGEAVKWYELAAKHGDMEAMNSMATLYLKGGDGLAQNMRKAATVYEEAAEKGFAAAQVNLAGLYETGQGVLKSFTTAYMWYTLAFDTADSETREMINDKTAYLTRGMAPEQVLDAKKRAAEWRAAKYR